MGSIISNYEVESEPKLDKNHVVDSLVGDNPYYVEPSNWIMDERGTREKKFKVATSKNINPCHSIWWNGWKQWENVLMTTTLHFISIEGMVDLYLRYVRAIISFIRLHARHMI